MSSEYTGLAEFKGCSQKHLNSKKTEKERERLRHKRFVETNGNEEKLDKPGKVSVSTCNC